MALLPAYGGGGSGSGFELGPEQNVFTSTTRAGAEALRDSYEGLNPSWLASYNANKLLNIRLEYDDGAGSLSVSQVRTSDSLGWADNISSLGIKGDAGADGTALEFTGVTERDAFFSGRLDLLKKNLPITIVVDTETVSNQVWLGENNPPTYNPELWFVATIRSGTASFELDEIHTFSSAGENVITSNEVSKLGFFSPWQYVGDHREASTRVVSNIPTSRIYNAPENPLSPPIPIELGGPRALSGSTPFNVDFDIQTSNTSLFGLSFIPEESYSGRLEFRVTNTDASIIVFSNVTEVVTVAGTEFTQWFKLPIETLLFQNLNARLAKIDDTDLLVRPELAFANRPYSTSFLRFFTDDDMLVVSRSSKQLLPVLKSGDNALVEFDDLLNTITINADGGVNYLAASATVDKSSTYGVNTTSGIVTLTVGPTVDWLVVFDSNEKFKSNSCFVALDGLVGSVELDSKNDRYLFYKDSLSVWRYAAISQDSAGSV